MSLKSYSSLQLQLKIGKKCRPFACKYGVLTLELSSFVLEIPSDAYMLRNHIQIGSPVKSNGQSKLRGPKQYEVNV